MNEGGLEVISGLLFALVPSLSAMGRVCAVNDAGGCQWLNGGENVLLLHGIRCYSG